MGMLVPYVKATFKKSFFVLFEKEIGLKKCFERFSSFTPV